jgi:hypothetical protein
MKRRRFLILYSLMLSLLATLTVLAVALRPPDGWWPQIQGQYDRFFAVKKIPYKPLIAPTPNQPQYQIQAQLDDGAHIVHGKETIKLPELRLDEIPFYLYALGDTTIQIGAVTLNGEPVKATVTGKEVRVPAKKSASPQTVTLEFTTKVPEKPSRSGYWKGVYTLSYWYPILGVERDGKWMPRPESLGFGDPYLMDLGTYQIELNTPAALKWYGSGAQTRQTPAADGRTVLSFAAEAVRNFALVGGSGFHQREFDTGTGTHVTVATLSDNRLDETTALARSAVKTYTEKIGLDPFPVLSVLELPKGTIYAHELPNLALFSQDLWGYDEPAHWIVHEIGHVWFYNSVGNYEVETPWLDEGLADYLALLDTETREGEEAYRAEIASDWERFSHNETYSPYKKGTPSGVKNGKTAVPYGTFATSQAHYYYSYLRPVLMYHDLRKYLGDERFFGFLRQYYTKNAGRTATRADLEQALADIDPKAVELLKLWLDTPNDELIGDVAGRFEK